MIKVSLKALTNILISHGHTFTIQRSRRHKDKLVLALVVGNEYPNIGPIIHYGKEDFETASSEVRDIAKVGKAIVLYDTSEDILLGVSPEVLDLIKEAKRKAIQAMFSKNKPQEQQGDEFGRQVQD